MKLTKKYSILTILFLYLISSASNAQIGSFRNVNNGDGLIDWQINCFFKDAEGFIWTGGTFLVQRFDGRYIKTYKLSKEATKIFAINETHDGVIYVATSNGLYTKQRNSSTLNLVYSTQITKNVFSILIDKKDNIYVGTQDGLAIISQGKLKSIQTQNTTFPFNQVLSIYQTNDGVLWLLTPGGIASYNPTTESTRTYPNMSITGHTYFTCMTAVGTTLYIGTDGAGIYSFDTRNCATQAFMEIGDGSVTCISSDGKSKLYAGTAGTGVYFISLQEKKVLTSFESSANNTVKLTSSMVTSLLVDNLGILWVGSSENLGFDFMFLQPKAFVLYKTPTFTTSNLAIHKFFIGDGFKLLSNRYGIYFLSEKDGNAQLFETGTGKAKCLRPGDVLSFISYGSKIILGGECGIYSFDPQSVSLKVFEPMAFLNKATIYHLTTDSNENLWVATSLGVHVLDKKTMQVTSYNTQNSHLPDDVVRFVYFDRKGRTWICTNKGICFWDDKIQDVKVSKFPKEFINNQQVHFMMEDRKGNILFCYNTKKAFVTDPLLKNFRKICTEDDADFTGNWINKVLQDASGTFWFIGSRGAIKADEGLTTFRLYSTTEGLMEPYATDGCFDKNGKLWLSNNKGLYSSSSPSSRIQRSTAPMVITDIRINGASEIDEMYDAIKKGSLIKLSRYKNNVEFQFSLLTYDKPDLMVYECKLKGHDTGWHILRGLNNFDYKNLKAGDYTFIVRRNMDHTCFKEVHFEIKPLLSTFEIILIIVFLGVAGWGYNHYTKLRTLIKTKIANNKTDTESKYRFNKINEEEATEIIEKLRECMKIKQLYLREELKIADLAKEVGCTSQTLSQVFNIFMNDKYYDFVNRYRIEEFKRIITTTDYLNFTLKALSQKSGFSSYTSFFRAFKEQTGITPNEFLQDFESSRKS
jgi:ligand-binding sensor domain-containing protein/AraC-like DNA-binding protein